MLIISSPYAPLKYFKIQKMLTGIINRDKSRSMVYGYSMPSCVLCSSFFGYRTYSTKDSLLEKLWNKFERKLLEDPNLSAKSSEKKVSQYQSAVLDILHYHKKGGVSFTEDELDGLQIKIEEISAQFDDVKNIYQSAPNLIKFFISKEKPSAKDYLKNCKLSSDDLSILDYFDLYTLEAIIIYVLGTLFHSLQESPAVRVSTMIEHLNIYVQSHARLLKSRKLGLTPSMSDRQTDANTEMKEQVTDKEATSKKKRSKAGEYAFGVFLVEFLVNRGLISLSKELSFKDLYVEERWSVLFTSQLLRNL